MTTSDPTAPQAPILATKLHPPRRRRTLIHRPRLSELPTQSRSRALTLVSAPAGFGKTTLVADWFADGGATAWLSLDPRDDDPTRFWTYVLATLEAAAPDLRSDAASLLQSPGVPLDVVVSTLINDLETASHDLVLVLDDFHVIESSEIHESVAFLLEHLPPQIRLVIATRADPPLPLASLRADGNLLEVRAADLRFTPEETSSYLADAMDLRLTAADVGVLEGRTEGWIAALQLAALSMQGRDDPSEFVAEFAGDDRFILDYLADEVLERQTPEVRDFLLATSILTRLTGPLCAAVTGVDDAKALLDDLERSNLFLVALDDRRTWYRYHHLFGEVLRARLHGDQAERVAELHRRASGWYAANDEPAEAITHALAGDDPTRAADLIELVATGMQQARQEAQLRAWLELLPPGVFADRPVLAMVLIGARMATGDATGLDPLLEIVDTWLDSSERPVVIDEDGYRRLPAMAAVHRAGLALLAGDFDAATSHAERILDLTEDEDLLQRGAAAALIGLAHWARGDLETARTRYTEAIDRFVAGNYRSDAMGCSLALADIQLTLGQLRDAQRTFETALDLAADRPGLRGSADMHVGLSLLALEHDDLQAAADHLRASADLGEHLGLPQHPYRWRVATARLHEAEGELAAALDLLTEAETRYTTDYSPSVRPVTAMKARIAVDLGDLDAGMRWATDNGLAPDDDLTYVREFEHLTLARVLIAQGTSGDIPALTQAIRLLDRLRSAAEQGGRVGSAIEAAILSAVALQAAGAEDGPLRALAYALQRADPEGYVRTFLDAGPEVVVMLRSLTGQPAGVELPPWVGPEPREQAARVLASAATADVRPRTRTSDPDELSDRELDVLRLLRSDLSGPDIARELHVSLNTLRTHTKHIYTKLGATNRREAVTRAAELGL